MEDYEEAIRKLESEMSNKPSESDVLEFPGTLNDEDSKDAGDNGEGEKKNNASDDEGSQLVKDNVGIELKQNMKYLTLDDGESDDDKIASKKVAFAAEDGREAIAREILEDVEEDDERVQKGYRRPQLDLEINDRVCKILDPRDLDRVYHSQVDERVCKASVPERFQFRCFPVQRIDSALPNYADNLQELSDEAEWIYCSASKDEPELKSPPVMPELVKTLKLIRESPFKESFIVCCREESVAKDPSFKDLWTTYSLNEYWTALQHRKRSHASSQKVNDFLESICANDPGNLMSKHTTSPVKLISYTRGAEFNVRLNYLLYYAKFVEPMKVSSKKQKTKELAEGKSKDSYENAKEDLDLALLENAAPVTVSIDPTTDRPSRLRQVCATASYEVANRVGVGGLAQRFGLSVTQFAENVQDQYLRYDVDRRPMLPTDTATDFLCPRLPYSSLALAAARHMLAFQISRELFVRRMMRQMFQLQVVMSVRSTAPGTKEINESHQLSAVKYLTNKLVTDLGYVLFLHIHNASRKKLLAYEIHVSNEQICGLSLNELQQFFHQDQFGWLVQAPNEPRSPILRQAAEEFISTTLIPERHEKMFRD